MKALAFCFFSLTFLRLFIAKEMTAQTCDNWSVPSAFSDSVTDNHNASLVRIPQWSTNYYVFWERSFEDSWSEIVYTDYYGISAPLVLVHANGFDLSNPQVIPVWGTPPATDTIAFVFYQYNIAGNVDIFYRVMTDTGFTASERFTNTSVNESHLRVSSGGGMVWQEGEMIKFCRLYYDNSGYHFEPVTTIDEGDCRNPNIQNTTGYSLEEYLAWEKGSNDEPEIWYSQWGWDSGQWSLPMMLFEDGHRGIKFSKGLTEFSTMAILLSDKKDIDGQYRISAYDFYIQEEYLSAFSQPESFQQDLLTIDILTETYWDAGYLAFKHVEWSGNSDIFSSDNGYLLPELSEYCRIDSTAQADVNPQLFEAAWHFSYFDLVCIWESWRNGHWQLFSCMTPVVIGDVHESLMNEELSISVFPNPFTENLQIESHIIKDLPVTLTIFNALGQCVFSYETIHLGGDDYHHNIKTADYLPGIYFLRVEAGNNATTQRLIKF